MVAVDLRIVVGGLSAYVEGRKNEVRRVRLTVD